MFIKLLTDRTSYTNDVKDLRQQWLSDLFLYIGLDIEWMEEADRGQIIDYFIENGIEVIEHASVDCLEVKLDGDVIGEWGSPELVMKEDESGLYFEAVVEYWSIMEEEIDIEED